LPAYAHATFSPHRGLRFCTHTRFPHLCVLHLLHTFWFTFVYSCWLLRIGLRGLTLTCRYWLRAPPFAAHCTRYRWFASIPRSVVCRTLLTHATRSTPTCIHHAFVTFNIHWFRFGCYTVLHSRRAWFGLHLHLFHVLPFLHGSRFLLAVPRTCRYHCLVMLCRCYATFTHVYTHARVHMYATFGSPFCGSHALLDNAHVHRARSHGLLSRSHGRRLVAPFLVCTLVARFSPFAVYSSFRVTSYTHRFTRCRSRCLGLARGLNTPHMGCVHGCYRAHVPVQRSRFCISWFWVGYRLHYAPDFLRSVTGCYTAYFISCWLPTVTLYGCAFQFTHYTRLRLPLFSFTPHACRLRHA